MDLLVRTVHTGDCIRLGITDGMRKRPDGLRLSYLVDSPEQHYIWGLVTAFLAECSSLSI